MLTLEEPVLSASKSRKMAQKLLTEGYLIGEIKHALQGVSIHQQRIIQRLSSTANAVQVAFPNLCVEPEPLKFRECLLSGASATKCMTGSRGFCYRSGCAATIRRPAVRTWHRPKHVTSQSSVTLASVCKGSPSHSASARNTCRRAKARCDASHGSTEVDTTWSGGWQTGSK